MKPKLLDGLMIQTKCPYCGKEQWVVVDGLHEGKNIKECETQYDGCGKDYIVDCVLKVETKIYTINENPVQ